MALWPTFSSKLTIFFWNGYCLIFDMGNVPKAELAFSFESRHAICVMASSFSSLEVNNEGSKKWKTVLRRWIELLLVHLQLLGSFPLLVLTSVFEKFVLSFYFVYAMTSVRANFIIKHISWTDTSATPVRSRLFVRFCWWTKLSSEFSKDEINPSTITCHCSISAVKIYIKIV